MIDKDGKVYRAVRRGSGKTVHATGLGGQLCGAGTNTTGTRKTYRARLVSEAVTCKTCLKRLRLRGVAI